MRSIFTIPNLLTIIRICTFPVLAWLVIQEMYVASFWLILAAGISDIIDGRIARAFNQQTNVGKLLDPLADKLFGATIYTSFSLKGVMAPWLGALVIGRDVIISLGALILVTLGMKVNIKPSQLGKDTTGVQVAAMALAILSVLPYTGPIVKTPGVLEIAFGTTGLFTIMSGTQYLYGTFKEYEKGLLLKDVHRPEGSEVT